MSGSFPEMEAKAIQAFIDIGLSEREAGQLVRQMLSRPITSAELASMAAGHGVDLFVLDEIADPMGRALKDAMQADELRKQIGTDVVFSMADELGDFHRLGASLKASREDAWLRAYNSPPKRPIATPRGQGENGPPTNRAARRRAEAQARSRRR